jgi:hypothetical protein
MHGPPGGAIVNIVADMWGSMPGMGHSGAARAGMVSFTETAAVEWGPRGVRVNAVAPGYVASSGMDNYPEAMAPMIREMAKTLPIGRFSTEAEISAGIVYLLSPAASFVNGTTLRIDAGRPAGAPGLADAPGRRQDPRARRHPALRRLSPRHGCPSCLPNPPTEKNRCPTPRSPTKTCRCWPKRPSGLRRPRSPLTSKPGRKAGELPQQTCTAAPPNSACWAWATPKRWAAPPPHGRCAMCWRPRWRAMVPAAA